MLGSSISPTQKLRAADKVESLNFNNISSRITENGSLSGRIPFLPKSLTISTNLTATPSSGLRHNSPALHSAELSRMKQTGEFSSNLLATLGVSPTHRTSNYKPRTLDMRRKTDNDLVLNTSREPNVEGLGNLLKSSAAQFVDFNQTARNGERNRSLEDLAPQLEALLQSKRLGSPTSTQSQAYTMAMKALQERIRQLEENKLVLEKQEEGYKKEIEGLMAKHEAEMAQVVKSERENVERAEVLERRNVELSNRVMNLEDENVYLNRQIKEQLMQKSAIEERYGRIISDKIQDAYEDIEYGVERLQKELDAALKNEEILKERLNKTVVDATHEKEALRVKNSTLAEALQRMEKDQSENQKMQTDKIEELAKKNRKLEDEIVNLKKGYSQQMSEFDKELEDIDKTHVSKVKEYESTIAQLKQKVTELETLYNTQKENNEAAKPLRIPLSTPKADLPNVIEIPGFEAESQQDLKPKKTMKIRTEFLNNFSEDSSDSTNRNRNSPRTNRSQYTMTNRSLMGQPLSTTRNMNGSKNTITSPQNQNHSESPQNKKSNQDIDSFPSLDEGSRRLPTSGDQESSRVKGNSKTLSNALPIKGMQQLRETVNLAKSLSFADVAVDSSERRDSNENAKSGVLSPILKESSYSLTRTKRKELENSTALSGRALSRRDSRVLDEQLAVKEKELKELNEEYQKLVQKTQESEDSKERSRMRAYLIEITEEIQQKNEEIYQLKKQGAAPRE